MVHMVNGTPTDSIIYSKNRQFRSGVNMKTGSCCCDSVFSQRRTVYVQYEQPKMPTAVKATFWSLAIKNFADVGMGIANFFMGIFGKKKAAAPVQTPVANQSNQVEKQGGTTPATSTPSVATPQLSSAPQEVKPEEEENNNKKQTNEKKYKVPTSVEMKDFSGDITVHDDELFGKLGEKSEITGKTTVSQDKGQGGYPKEMKVGNYNYTLAKVDPDGTVWYKSKDGSGQLYRLEKNANGTFGLNQHSGDDGVGIADISKWGKPSSAASEKKEVRQAEKKETPAGLQGRTDEELKDTMHINEKLDLKKIPTFNDMSTDKYGKPYSPMTVTYGYSPEMQTVDISAKEVAECQGDEAKIKDLALKKIREKEQPGSQKTK